MYVYVRMYVCGFDATGEGGLELWGGGGGGRSERRGGKGRFSVAFQVIINPVHWINCHLELFPCVAL